MPGGCWEKRPRMSALELAAIISVRSEKSWSLFLSRKPSISYSTLPAECRMMNDVCRSFGWLRVCGRARLVSLDSLRASAVRWLARMYRSYQVSTQYGSQAWNRALVLCVSTGTARRTRRWYPYKTLVPGRVGEDSTAVPEVVPATLLLRQHLQERLAAAYLASAPGSAARMRGTTQSSAEGMRSMTEGSEDGVRSTIECEWTWSVAVANIHCRSSGEKGGNQGRARRNVRTPRRMQRESAAAEQRGEGGGKIATTRREQAKEWRREREGGREDASARESRNASKRTRRRGAQWDLVVEDGEEAVGAALEEVEHPEVVRVLHMRPVHSLRRVLLLLLRKPASQRMPRAHGTERGSVAGCFGEFWGAVVCEV